MDDDREAILSSVRAALAPLTERAPMPAYDGPLELARERAGAGDRLGEFSARLKAVNGEMVADPPTLAESLRRRGWTRGYCDPQLWARLAPHLGGFTVETVFDR